MNYWMNRSFLKNAREKIGSCNPPEDNLSIFSPGLNPLKYIVVLVYCCFFASAQSTNAQSDTIRNIIDSLSNPETNIQAHTHTFTSNQQPRYKNRQRGVGYSSIAAYGGMLYTLNKAWYAKYPRTGFHFYNDNGEWNQMDKVGHTWSVYQLTRASFRAWDWAGASQKKALTMAGISGPGFLTIIEILDGFSNKWGFSWGDMGANLLGSGLFIGQELGWNEQRISVKFSFHLNTYPETMLQNRANNLFGKAWNERMLKDYNAQTYWLSGNLKSFFPETRLPSWLNMAVGYGADGMFGGYENKWTDADGNPVTRSDIKRKRQFYLAPDVDLTKIKTKSKFLKTSFFILNSLKFPAPALQIDTEGNVKLQGLWF